MLALAVVRYTTSRLRKYTDVREHGCRNMNPHRYTLEEGWMKKIDRTSSLQAAGRSKGILQSRQDYRPGKTGIDFSTGLLGFPDGGG